MSTSTLTCSIKLEQSVTQEYPVTTSDSLALFDSLNNNNNSNNNGNSSAHEVAKPAATQEMSLFFPVLDGFKEEFDLLPFSSDAATLNGSAITPTVSSI